MRNMRNKDSIKQKNTVNKKNVHKAKAIIENSSSDFSEFQLQKSSSQGERDFSPYQPPSSWKRNEDQIKQGRLKKQPALIVKKRLMKEKNNKRSQRKQASEDSSYSSIKENIVEKNQMRTHISDKKNRNRENEEELIAEYSKRDFKQALKECIVERKSDKKEVVENQEGLHYEAKGGICFDLDVKEFVYKDHKSEGKKKKKKKRSHHLNSPEQILKRRQQAFNYGQAIRRRTFGHY